MNAPEQLSFIDMIESLVVRTHGTEFHGDVIHLRAAYLANFADMRHDHAQDPAPIILPIVATAFKVTVHEMLAKSRSRQPTHARAVGMYLLRKLTLLSLPDIAKELNRKDHTTAMCALRKVTSKIRADAHYATKINALAQLCATALAKQSEAAAA